MVNTVKQLRKDTESIIDVNPSLLFFIRREREKNEYGNVREVEKRTEIQRIRIASRTAKPTDFCKKDC